MRRHLVDPLVPVEPHVLDRIHRRIHRPGPLEVVGDHKPAAGLQCSPDARQHLSRVVVVRIGIDREGAAGRCRRQLRIGFRAEDPGDVGEMAVPGARMFEKIRENILGVNRAGGPGGFAQQGQQGPCACAQVRHRHARLSAGVPENRPSVQPFGPVLRTEVVEHRAPAFRGAVVEIGVFGRPSLVSYAAFDGHRQRRLHHEAEPRHLFHRGAHG